MKIFRRLLSLTALIGLFASASASADTYLIDVRDADEYAEDHATDATNIPYDEIADKISALTSNKEDTIYLYCRSGRRADIAAQTLKALGYQNVTNLGTLQNAKDADVTVTNTTP